MNVAIFSARKYDREFLNAANGSRHELRFFEPHLNEETVSLAAGFEAVCVFVNDQVNAAMIAKLRSLGVRLIALRCAGYNNIDLSAAKKHGVTVVRVPAYSPYAVAEHTIALMLALNRKLHRAYNRVREGNFALDGLVGFDMNGKTVGIIGTGKIGTVVALNELFAQSDIISLHCPLTPENKYIISKAAIARMKNGVMLINTSRGALLDTVAIIEGLKSGKIGYLGLDVYEEEEDIFFEDRSGLILSDDVFARLLTFPNVIITGHQAFFTREALLNIAATTIDNITKFENNQPLEKLAD